MFLNDKERAKRLREAPECDTCGGRPVYVGEFEIHCSTKDCGRGHVNTTSWCRSQAAKAAVRTRKLSKPQREVMKREVAAIMESAGYKLVRKGKHNIWSNGAYMIVTAVSPSDQRALKNIRAEVRRASRKAAAACP